MVCLLREKVRDAAPVRHALDARPGVAEQLEALAAPERVAGQDEATQAGERQGEEGLGGAVDEAARAAGTSGLSGPG
jgi:hypothetical protein